MTDPIVLRAVADLLHLRVRAGEDVIVYPDGRMDVVRALTPPNAGAVVGALVDGTLVPSPGVNPAEVIRQLRAG